MGSILVTEVDFHNHFVVFLNPYRYCIHVLSSTGLNNGRIIWCVVVFIRELKLREGGEGAIASSLRIRRVNLCLSLLLYCYSRQIAGWIISCAVCVISKESRRLVLPITSCVNHNFIFHWSSTALRAWEKCDGALASHKCGVPPHIKSHIKVRVYVTNT
jgi:hypothetical protein